MLILTRNIGDRIVIDDNIVITVVRIRGQRAQLGFEAPLDVAIRRAEQLATAPPQDQPHVVVDVKPR
jgi:carbon storage regulator